MPGIEWVVEATGCDPAPLADPAAMGALFDAIVADLALRPVAPALWHRFPGPGGVTGVIVLAESHLACHTFPEHGAACLNLFCCAPRPEWDWEAELRRRLGATTVRVRRLDRPYDEPDAGSSGIAAAAAGVTPAAPGAPGTVSPRAAAGAA